MVGNITTVTGFFALILTFIIEKLTLHMSFRLFGVI